MTAVVSLVGWDRSGTTLLAGALGALDGAITIGETINLWERGIRQDRTCSCQLPFSECVFWSQVTKRIFRSTDAAAEEAQAAKKGLGNLWLIRTKLPGADRALAAADDYVALLRRLYEAVADVSGAQLIIDASKTPWHAAAAARTGFDAKVIHVVRDPRGVANSLAKHVAYDDAEEMNRHSATFSSAAWVYRNTLSEWVWRNDPMYVRIRYEDLVGDPQTELHRIAGALHLGDTSRLAAPEGLAVKHEHNVAGNPNRFRSGPVRLQPDEAWRREMPIAMQRYVLTLTWPLRRRYGYT